MSLKEFYNMEEMKELLNRQFDHYVRAIEANDYKEIDHWERIANRRRNKKVLNRN